MEAPSSAQMVEPLPVSDIYLCDYCGADFSTLIAIKVFFLHYIALFVTTMFDWHFQAHEGKCMAEKFLESQSSNSYVEMETNNPDQVIFNDRHYSGIVITILDVSLLG